MVLVQEGKLKLEDNISQYLEGSPDTWKPITQTLVDAQRQGSSAKAEMLRESQTDLHDRSAPHDVQFRERRNGAALHGTQG